ncbi:MAG: alpha-galactosidase [Oscillospiraceae bacterium]|nr:alpha-galactosidase [Oscillospiraceae bacterium]
MQYKIYENGSFDLRGEGISLLGCYPSVDGCPLRPTGVEVTEGSAAYSLPGAELRLSLRPDASGRVALACSARGLAGIHDIEPLGGAGIAGAAGAYVQGLGMEGPSGCHRLGAEMPLSYGLTALYGEAGALLAYAESHERYTVFFQTETRAALAGARTEFSGGFNLEGTAGGELVLPTLYFEEAPALAEGLRRCAERIGGAMGARKRMPPAFFWNSWYHAYETMDQALLEEVLEGIRRENIPFQYIELDAGYTPALGDWLVPNHRWPGGLAQAARTILDAGYQAGIWIGPFIVGSESALYREHPDWVLKDLDGKPAVQLRSYTEPKIWGNRDGEYYVLDASHPEALAYLERVFRTLKSWGFRFFKTDFMLWNMHDSSTVRRHTPGLTSVEILRRVLEVIRDAIGEESYLLGCIAPFMPFLGYADGMRIAGDGGARWAEPYGPINLLRELPCDNYFNHVFWQNDPDAVLLRDFDTLLTEEEARSLALLQALSGGAVSTSDPVHRLSEERKALLRFIEPHGAHTPELPFPGAGHKELVLLHRLEQGNLLYILNPTEEALPVAFRLSELFGEKQWYLYRYGEAPGAERGGIVFERLPPHGSVLLFVTEAPLAEAPRNLWNW